MNQKVSVFLAGLLIVIVLGVATTTLELSYQSDAERPAWSPASLVSLTPTPSSTPGWWGDVPTPVPLRTATPTSTPTTTPEE